MSDIRKRSGPKGDTYQVRFASKTAKSGYGYATFTTRKEAREFLESGKAKDAGSAPSADGTIITVAQGIQKWLEICEREGRDGRDPVTAFTLKGYKYRAEVINTYPWRKNLSQLTAPDIIEFRSWLSENYPRSMAHFILSSFHSMILEMVFRGILVHDVAARVSIRERSRYAEPVMIPSEKEVKDLLKAADALANSKNAQIQGVWQRYRPMLYLAADSGMRPQEYIAVAVQSLQHGGLRVSRAVERSGAKLSVPKTAAGRRFIDLSPDVYGMVRHYADKHAIQNDYDLIFPTSTGRWQSPDNWRKRGFAAACEKAGLMTVADVDGETVERPKYVPYDLRHFYASVLIASRMDLKTIQTLMGHEDIKTTLNVYGHLLQRLPSESERRGGMLSALAAH